MLLVLVLGLRLPLPQRVYVTLFPCNECAKLLIQAGIREVVYHEAKIQPPGDVVSGSASAKRGSNTPADAADAVDTVDGCAAGHIDQACAEVPGCVGAVEISPSAKAGRCASANDLDASYIASQRLLTLAGVTLRQHALARCIVLGAAGCTAV